MNPSLEASWRHPWRQDLHTGAGGGAGEVFIGTLEFLWCHPCCHDLRTGKQNGFELEVLERNRIDE
ncbi:hypothetical protein [Halorhodospira halochloris]|uniref:hypothetical protein n=1 Tax=Halorhodospira halochloris TaxID=1052 RepID=UPI000BBA9E32|nr:hypothetical protein [Halorhodospira halochloris]MBK1652721.1 hypothetical protein [Halorhodospira halochloris]